MTIEQLNTFCKDTLIDHLGIEFTAASTGQLTARMPVDKRTIQPMKLLHGGAMLALAETVASAGSFLITDISVYRVVGMSVTANHIGNTREAYVEAVAQLEHKGNLTHVWSVKISDATGKPLSLCRVTNMLVRKEGN